MLFNLRLTLGRYTSVKHPRTPHYCDLDAVTSTAYKFGGDIKEKPKCLYLIL